MNPGYTQTGCTPLIMGTRLINGSSKAKTFPNPVTNKLIISGDQNYDVFLLNPFGEDMGIKKFENNSIDLSHFPKGIYFLKIFEAGNLISTEKIIKE
jgi:hypothetical protein